MDSNLDPCLKSKISKIRFFVFFSLFLLIFLLRATNVFRSDQCRFNSPSKRGKWHALRLLQRFSRAFTKLVHAPESTSTPCFANNKLLTLNSNRTSNRVPFYTKILVKLQFVFHFVRDLFTFLLHLYSLFMLLNRYFALEIKFQSMISHVRTYIM